MSQAQAGKDANKPGRTRVLKKGLFAKDLAPMMYGFGDENPAPDTISVMEELLIEHITDICTQAQRISTNRGKIKVDDFKFALRKDPKKLARVDELLFMTEVISRARGKEDFTQYADESDLAKKGTTGGGVGGGSGTATAAAGDGGASKKSKGKGKAKG